MLASIESFNWGKLPFRPNPADPHERLAFNAALFAIRTATLIRQNDAVALKQDFLVWEYVQSEAGAAANRKFESVYLHCLHAQVNVTDMPWVLDLMPPQLRAKYLEIFQR